MQKTQEKAEDESKFHENKKGVCVDGNKNCTLKNGG